MSGRQKAYWGLVAVTAVIYLLMLFWTLPYITTEAGGLLVFDLRTTGYSAADARAFLTRLSPEGAAFYMQTQRWLDTAFPVLFALCLVFPLWVLSRGRSPAFRVVLLVFPALALITDYLENAAVAVMVRGGTAGLTPEMAASASRWTVVKFSAIGVSGLALVLLALIAGWSRWRRSGDRT